jgi:hypothetical protein
MKTIAQLHKELEDVDTDFADWSESDRYALKKTLEATIAYRESLEDCKVKEIPTIPALESRMDQSLVKYHKRGYRRYFPIIAKDLHSWAPYFEAYEIIFGKKATDKAVVGNAILFHGLDSYIEKFEGRLWVRTIYKVDWEKKSPPLLKF